MGRVGSEVCPVVLGAGDTSAHHSRVKLSMAKERLSPTANSCNPLVSRRGTAVPSGQVEHGDFGRVSDEAGECVCFSRDAWQNGCN